MGVDCTERGDEGTGNGGESPEAANQETDDIFLGETAKLGPAADSIGGRRGSPIEIFEAIISDGVACVYVFQPFAIIKN